MRRERTRARLAGREVFGIGCRQPTNWGSLSLMNYSRNGPLPEDFSAPPIEMPLVPEQFVCFDLPLSLCVSLAVSFQLDASFICLRHLFTCLSIQRGPQLVDSAATPSGVYPRPLLYLQFLRGVIFLSSLKDVGLPRLVECCINAANKTNKTISEAEGRTIEPRQDVPREYGRPELGKILLEATHLYEN